MAESTDWRRPSGWGFATPRWEGRRVLRRKMGVHVVALGSIWKGDGRLPEDVFYWGRTKARPRSLRHMLPA